MLAADTVQTNKDYVALHERVASYCDSSFMKVIISCLGAVPGSFSPRTKSLAVQFFS